MHIEAGGATLGATVREVDLAHLKTPAYSCLRMCRIM